MRPVDHTILVTCVLTTFWPAIAKCELASLWNHNGSVMALHVDGADQVFRYQEPRLGMRQEGVVSGTVRFKGTRSGNTYSGTAFVFSRRCGTHSYPVTGTVSDDQRQIVMYGSAPAGFDEACRLVVHRKDAVHFSFLRFVDPPPLVAPKIQPDPSAAERARSEEARAAKEHEEQALRNLHEQQERQARDLREQQERAERARREHEQEEQRLAEGRSFANGRDGCRKYNVEACEVALNSPRAGPQDVTDLRNWRGVAEKFRADLDSCRTGSVAACDEALASPAVAAEQRPLLDEWRIAASPLNRAMTLLSAHARRAATAAIDGVSTIRDLRTTTLAAGGLAAVLALALAAVLLGRRHPHPSGSPTASTSRIATSTINQARSVVGRLQYLSGNLTRLLAVIRHPAQSAARDAPGAIEALELAHAYVEKVREGATPTLEDHESRRHHLDMLALASMQLDAARRLDPDAILERQDEKGIVYRFSIDELEAKALLIEGITVHAYDIKRAVRALRRATTLNANSSYAFYVLGAMHAANMNRGEAVVALQRAVALKPQDLSYRKELDRAQSLSVAEIAAYKVTRAGESIFGPVIAARNILARTWRIVRFPRRILFIYRGAFRLLGPLRFH